MHGIIPIDHLIYPLVLSPFPLHGECFWHSQTMGPITMNNITKGLIQLGQFIQIYALPPAPPLGVLSTARKPLMTRGAWECFIIFRPMMQKLLNFEYFHQQKFKIKSLGNLGCNLGILRKPLVSMATWRWFHHFHNYVCESDWILRKFCHCKLNNDFKTNF
jgi:hypothetical protein